MPRRRDWELNAAMIWQQRAGLSPPSHEETILGFITRVARGASEHYTLTELANMLEKDLGVKRTRQALSLFFLSLGVSTKMKVDKDTKRTAIEILEKHPELTVKEVAISLDIKPSILAYHAQKAFSKESLCTICNKKFTRKQRRKRFCSTVCYTQYRYPPDKKMGLEYPCTECGALFLKTGPRKKFCNDCGTQNEHCRRWREKKARYEL